MRAGTWRGGSGGRGLCSTGAGMFSALCCCTSRRTVGNVSPGKAPLGGEVKRGAFASSFLDKLQVLSAGPAGTLRLDKDVVWLGHFKRDML